MNLIDVLVIVLVGFAIYRGRQIGFTRQFLSTFGFFSGLLLGAWLQPHVVKLVHGELAKSLVTLFTTLGLGLLLMATGEHYGIKLKLKLIRGRIDKYDNGFGAGLAAVSVLLMVWLCANIFASLPSSSLQTTVNNSKIVSFLTEHLPAAPAAIAKLNGLIDPNGFPKVFTGQEPAPNTANVSPSLKGFDKAIAVTKNSVVKLEGQGCGGIVEGSGFVVADRLIATNAHVIAGIAHPYVVDKNGTHHAVPIWFDPNLDFAVLRVNNLAGKPLTFNPNTQATGSNQAVLGYPGGGNLDVESAAILDRFIATGRNIYGQGKTERDVYEIKAHIIPGNSGGPMVDKAGNVTGVVFAESGSYQNVGYTLTAQKAAAEIQAAKGSDQPVSTGNCAE
jgi:S1-C subfamily serine protease